MSLIEIARDTSTNPLDVVEHMAAGNNWPFERAGEDEIAIVVTGRWTNYQVSFTWMSEIEALHFACAFDMRDTGTAALQGAAPRRPHQRAIVDRTFRRLDAEWRGDVSPCAAARRRRQRLGPAVRGAARDRTRCLRTLLPGVPVRGLGGQIGARSDGLGHVRDLRRGVGSE